MTPTISPTPQYGWCPECLDAWTPAMTAVRFHTNNGVAIICDACIAKAHRAAQAERQRRQDEDKARRQQ